jgi:hypothetical protein
MSAPADVGFNLDNEDLRKKLTNINILHKEKFLCDVRNLSFLCQLNGTLRIPWLLLESDLNCMQTYINTLPPL